MKIKTLGIGALMLLVLLLCSGCRQEWKDFTFSYTAESVGNYKLVVTFRSDSTFRIEKYNYYMDNFEKKKRPDIREGRLSASEFAACERQLRESDLFSLQDTYGYKKNETQQTPSSDIICQVHLQTGAKEKFITYKNSGELPPSFGQLLKWIHAFLSDH